MTRLSRNRRQGRLESIACVIRKVQFDGGVATRQMLLTYVYKHCFQYTQSKTQISQDNFLALKTEKSARFSFVLPNFGVNIQKRKKKSSCQGWVAISVTDHCEAKLVLTTPLAQIPTNLV